jgi:serine/threonine-protein kinase
VPRLQLLLERATEKHPEDRFVSARDMREALKGLLQTLGSETTRLQSVQRTTGMARPSGSEPEQADAGPSDAGPSDGRPSDAGRSDTGRSDAGRSDAGRSEAGPAAAAFDAETLRLIEERLKTYIGPIATVLVRTCASRRHTAAQLVSELALSIAHQVERERFRRDVEQLLRPHRARAATSLTGPDAVAGRLPDHELERARVALTDYVGPIARVLVRQAAGQVSTVEALWQRLAQHVELPQERAAFLARRDQ